MGILQSKVSPQRIGFLGSFFVWGGLVATAFAPTIAWTAFTYGIIHGNDSSVSLGRHAQNISLEQKNLKLSNLTKIIHDDPLNMT